jgi:hypothetical protein
MMIIENGVKTTFQIETAVQAQAAMDRIEYYNQFKDQKTEYIVDVDPALELSFMQIGELAYA